MDELEKIAIWIAEANNLKLDRIHHDEVVLILTRRKNLKKLKLPSECVVIGNRIKIKGRVLNSTIRIAKRVYRFNNGRLEKLLKVYSR